MRWNFFVVEAFRSLRQNLATTLAACVTVLVVMFIAGIGLALASRLADSGHHPIGLARGAAPGFPGDFHQVDLADRAATGEALAR